MNNLNQILYIPKNHKYNNYFKLKKLNFFRFIFGISVILFIISISLLFFINYSTINQESIASEIINNYNVSKLYNENTDSSYNYFQYNNNKILGFIEIPKLNIYYPVFANISDDLLKVSPCRFSGPDPNTNGNLCIAGHNYNNSKFFSKINTLKNGDKILLYDTSNNKIIYNLYANYEVNSNNISPIIVSHNGIKELTLVTCNNYNGNRIIVKAKEM